VFQPGVGDPRAREPQISEDRQFLKMNEPSVRNLRVIQVECFEPPQSFDVLDSNVSGGALCERVAMK